MEASTLLVYTEIKTLFIFSFKCNQIASTTTVVNTNMNNHPAAFRSNRSKPLAKVKRGVFNQISFIMKS